MLTGYLLLVLDCRLSKKEFPEEPGTIIFLWPIIFIAVILALLIEKLKNSTILKKIHNKLMGK